MHEIWHESSALRSIIRLLLNDYLHFQLYQLFKLLNSYFSVNYFYFRPVTCLMVQLMAFRLILGIIFDSRLIAHGQEGPAQPPWPEGAPGPDLGSGLGRSFDPRGLGRPFLAMSREPNIMSRIN